MKKLLVLFALTLTPAKAQFGGGGGGQDMMTQMAPMLEMMKKKTSIAPVAQPLVVQPGKEVRGTGPGDWIGA